MKEGESSYNPCKDRGCNACCQNVTLKMSFPEFDIFSRKYREDGNVLHKKERKKSIRERGEDFPLFFLNTVIWYAANHSFEKYLNTGEHPNTEAFVLIEGVCPNNHDGECTIYDQRPAKCRTLAVDSPNCKFSQNEIKSAPNFIPLSEIGFPEVQLAAD